MSAFCFQLYFFPLTLQPLYFQHFFFLSMAKVQGVWSQPCACHTGIGPKQCYQLYSDWQGEEAHAQKLQVILRFQNGIKIGVRQEVQFPRKTMQNTKEAGSDQNSQPEVKRYVVQNLTRNVGTLRAKPGSQSTWTKRVGAEQKKKQHTVMKYQNKKDGNVHMTQISPSVGNQGLIIKN